LFYVLPIRAYFRDCVYVYNPGSLPNNRACIAIPTAANQSVVPER